VLNAYRLAYDINQTHFRTEFNYNPAINIQLNFGCTRSIIKYIPGFEPTSTQSLVATDKVPQEQAVESAVYLGDKYNITPEFSINAGIRFHYSVILGT
jgi:outer membrane receptor for ferrienterochelin and colicin